MKDKRQFNWRPNHDPRSRHHELEILGSKDPVFAEVEWKKRVVLDQGSEGACTGFSMAHVLASTPRQRTGVNNKFALGLYALAKENDEWPGSDYDGSSVNGVCKAARAKRLISGWKWSFDFVTFVAGIRSFGPPVIGMPWLRGMTKPDRDGIVRATGDVVGGHAIEGGIPCLILPNSWGRDWGVQGTCYLPLEDFKNLLAKKNQIEVAFVTKL